MTQLVGIKGIVVDIPGLSDSFFYAAMADDKNIAGLLIKAGGDATLWNQI